MRGKTEVLPRRRIQSQANSFCLFKRPEKSIWMVSMSVAFPSFLVSLVKMLLKTAGLWSWRWTWVDDFQTFVVSHCVSKHRMIVFFNANLERFNSQEVLYQKPSGLRALCRWFDGWPLWNSCERLLCIGPRWRINPFSLNPYSPNWIAWWDNIGHYKVIASLMIRSIILPVLKVRIIVLSFDVPVFNPFFGYEC